MAREEPLVGVLLQLAPLRPLRPQVWAPRAGTQVRTHGRDICRGHKVPLGRRHKKGAAHKASWSLPLAGRKKTQLTNKKRGRGEEEERTRGPAGEEKPFTC